MNILKALRIDYRLNKIHFIHLYEYGLYKFNKSYFSITKSTSVYKFEVTFMSYETWRSF